MRAWFISRAIVGRAVAVGFALTTCVSAPARSGKQSSTCKAIADHGKLIKRVDDLNLLSPEIQTDLKGRLGSIATIGENYQQIDVALPGKIPRWRFNDAILLDGRWIIFLDSGLNRLTSVGYVLQTDTKSGGKVFSYLSSYHFIGQKCPILSAILDGVESP